GRASGERSTARRPRRPSGTSSGGPTRSMPTSCSRPERRGASRSCSDPNSRLALLALPGGEHVVDVPPLRVGERRLRQHPARLRGIVVLDRGLEVLTKHTRLPELPPQPAQEADARLVHATPQPRAPRSRRPDLRRHPGGVVEASPARRAERRNQAARRRLAAKGHRHPVLSPIVKVTVPSLGARVRPSTPCPSWPRPRTRPSPAIRSS